MVVVVLNDAPAPRMVPRYAERIVYEFGSPIVVGRSVLLRLNASSANLLRDPAQRLWDLRMRIEPATRSTVTSKCEV